MGSGPRTDDRVIAVIRDNAASLLRIAGQHSLCADDAQDAYQRTLEIYLERLDRVQDATAGQWLRTVCKHEAMRIRDQRRRILPPEEVVWDVHLAADAREPEERAASLERVGRAAEALQGCKPDEATAILLKADGSSYAEIGELTGWSYTKVNRCLAEGRARFLRRYDAIDSGAACEAWLPVLSAIVDGEATPDDFTRVRPHLRHCSSCRATLRALYEAEPALGALVPAGALVAAGGGAEPVSGVVARAYEALVTGAGDRIARLHAVVEAVTSTKAAAVVASTAAVAAGGAAAADRVPLPRAAPAAEVAAVGDRPAPRRAPGAPRRRRPAGAPAPAAAPSGAAVSRRTPSDAGAASSSQDPRPTSERGGSRRAAASGAPATPPDPPEASRDFAVEAAAARPAAPHREPAPRAAEASAGDPDPTGTSEFGFEG